MIGITTAVYRHTQCSKDYRECECLYSRGWTSRIGKAPISVRYCIILVDTNVPCIWLVRSHVTSNIYIIPYLLLIYSTCKMQCSYWHTQVYFKCAQLLTVHFDITFQSTAIRNVYLQFFPPFPPYSWRKRGRTDLAPQTRLLIFPCFRSIFLHIRASVDALYRNGMGQISRDPRTKCLKTRREWLTRLKNH